MSTINVNQMVDSQGGVLAPISSVMRNRIINGGMVLDQRNAGASVTPANSAYTLDRWQAVMFSTSARYSVQQNAGSVTPPAGFRNYLGITSLSAHSVTGNDIYAIGQPIEGFNMADFAWGTASASAVTLSFWVRSSLTGTFGGAFSNASDRSYPFTYTISAANTWEQKSVTIAGDTSGTWNTTNGTNIQLRFGLGAGASSIFAGTAGSWQAGNFSTATGATSVVGTNGATFYITGVQLEKGTQATSFEYRQYGQELQLCQRYYYKNNYSASAIIGTVQAYNTTGSAFGQLFTHPVPMRTTPTSTNSGNTTFQLTNTVSARTATTLFGITPTLQGIVLGDSSSGSTTIAGGASVVYSNTGGTTYIDASAEL